VPEDDWITIDHEQIRWAKSAAEDMMFASIAAFEAGGPTEEILSRWLRTAFFPTAAGFAGEGVRDNEQRIYWLLWMLTTIAANQAKAIADATGKTPYEQVRGEFETIKRRASSAPLALPI
jgi:hypothetical protein